LLTLVDRLADGPSRADTAGLRAALEETRDVCAEVARLLEAHGGDMTPIGTLASWANEAALKADAALAPPTPKESA
jgi:hypothetical protein